MISKHISIKHDSYSRLADYVRDAKASSDYATTSEYIEDKPNAGEKVLYAWHQGCIADNYDLGIKEVLATQKMNTRSQKSKTYHMIVSFRPEDENKLTEEAFRSIEEAFANALGFQEHQRHCGVHKNTANIHMHIAYNMIHPQKFTRLEPYRDYKTLAGVCRQMESQYGLTVDNGMEGDAIKRTNERAHTVEARTGQQSFSSYLQERREQLIKALEESQTWADIHIALGKVGVILQLRGNGCVLKDAHGQHAVKGSSLSREFSFAQLVKRFGPFKAQEKAPATKEHYTAKPLRGSERGELYLEFKRGIDERKAVLEALADERKNTAATIKKKWQLQREKIQASNQYLRNDKHWLISRTRVQEQTEITGALETQEKKKKALREKVPYANWLEFLQYKAKDHGNELALEILRGKDPERGELLAEYHTGIDEKYTNWEEFLQNKAKQGNELALELLRKKSVHAAQSVNETDRAKKGIMWKTRLAEIAADTALIRKDKRVLTGVTKMLELQDRGLAGTEGLVHSIDLQGVIIFKLRSGGQVRDDGKTISYSAFDQDAQRIAAKYAATRFGKYRIDGNTLSADRRESELENQR
jgi:hypothetical protein